MLNKLRVVLNPKKKNQKVKFQHNKNYKPKTEIVYKYGIENNIQISAKEVSKLVGKSMNYRPLDIRSKRMGKSSEEEKATIYKQVVPQYEIIKYLIDNKKENISINKINYSKLDNKIQELEEKRNHKINLLELDLYSSCIDEFYILKAYMDKELH